jgi:DNA polymerase
MVAPVSSGADLDWPERHGRLALLEREVSQCRACGLCDGRTNTVFARGDGTVGVAFVGEGPGADEDAQGLPFVGAAGQLLDKMIVAMGLSREAVYVCNIVKCRPPNNRKPTEEEMAACRHYVVSQLDLVQPRVIVAMGATAVEGLLGVKLGITRLRGTWRLYKGTIPVMPTFHPAYLLRQPDAKRQVWEDLQAVLTRLNLPIPQRRK